MTSFVNELHRSANEIRTLTDVQKRNLLDRAATAIRDMHKELSAHGHLAFNGRQGQIQKELLALSLEVSIAPDLIVGHCLLESADVITQLKRLLEGE